MPSFLHVSAIFAIYKWNRALYPCTFFVFHVLCFPRALVIAIVQWLKCPSRQSFGPHIFQSLVGKTFCQGNLRKKSTGCWTPSLQVLNISEKGVLPHSIPRGCAIYYPWWLNRLYPMARVIRWSEMRCEQFDLRRDGWTVDLEAFSAFGPLKKCDIINTIRWSHVAMETKTKIWIQFPH
jgi:hypothetical protein